METLLQLISTCSNKYTVYGRHLQANVGQCRNGDNEPQRISFAVIIFVGVLKERKKERNKETKKETKKQSPVKLKDQC